MKSSSSKSKLKSSESKKLTGIKAKPTLCPNWSSIIIGTGSNAFNQCNLDLELNSTSFVAVNVPPYDQDRHKVTSISCGSSLSAAVVESLDDSNSSTCYVWGSGLPGAATRIPTSIGNFLVKKVSCGQDHVGIISVEGKAYTWGSGDNGMLGHGTKQTQNNPKLVNALKDNVCLDISCGGFHTAFVCCSADKIRTTFLPDVDNTVPPIFSGNLYCCGLSKAGQLGIGTPNRPFLATPVKVSLPDCNNYCFGVSCGFHHTAIVTFTDCSETNPSLVESSVYCFGWGEYGRLGNGDEEQRFEPTKVVFPPPTSASSSSSSSSKAFIPVKVSSGEQHTIALGSNGICYSWGNNSHGQLGLGNPATTPQQLTPLRVPVPEGMTISSISSGGRHTMAVSGCGKVLSWGWGEEGQLGHGSEKNSYLPRPVRIPRLEGIVGAPACVAAGMSHSLCVVSNEEFIYSPPKVAEPAIVAEAKEELPKVPTTTEMKFYTPAYVESDEEEEEEVMPARTRKHALVADDDAFVELPEDEPVVRSVRELLKRKEDALQPAEPEQHFFVTDSAEFDAFPLPSDLEIEEDLPAEPLAIVVEEEAAVIEEEPLLICTEYNEDNSLKEDKFEGFDTEIAEELDIQAAEAAVQPNTTEAYRTKPNIPKSGIFYKEGQDYDKCLVANSARRAELRKAKKQSQTTNNHK